MFMPLVHVSKLSSDPGRIKSENQLMCGKDKANNWQWR